MNTCDLGSQASARSSGSGMWTNKCSGCQWRAGFQGGSALARALDWEPGELGTKQNSCRVQITMCGGRGEWA